MRMDDRIPIIICGGHLSPALAVICEIQKEKKYKIYYVGRKIALEGDRAFSLEYQTAISYNIPFIELNPARLQRKFTVYTLSSLLRFPMSIIQSLLILIRVKPKLVLSFGGYVALPISLAASMLDISVITHEQTHVMGLTNRIISRIAREVCVSWHDTAKIPSGVKVEMTGLPLKFSNDINCHNSFIDKSVNSSKSMHNINKEKQSLRFGDEKLPFLFITGGSLGSRSVNNMIEPVLAELLKNFRILHQTGAADNSKDFEILDRLNSRLPNYLRNNYRVIKHAYPFEIENILSYSDLVLGRSGANTTAEVQYFAIPAVFIPLPWAADNEQQCNAEYLKNLGMAEIVEQNNTSEYMLGVIMKIKNNYKFYKKNALSAQRLLIKDGSGRMLDVINRCIKS